MASLVEDDRDAALAAGGRDALAALFARVPSLAPLVEGRGPLAYLAHQGYPSSGASPSRRVVARRLALPGVVAVCAAHATRTESQLLALAAWEGGALATLGDASAVAPGAHPEQLERAASGLADLVLVDRSAHWLALRPGVESHVALPGIPVDARYRHASNEVLAARLKRLGIRPPSKRGQRLAILQAALRDRDVVLATLRALGRREQTVFDILVTRGPTEAAALPGCETYTPWSSRPTPLTDLVDAGLVWVDTDAGVAFAWLDVIVALGGSLFGDWSEPTAPTRTAPSASSAVGVPVSLARFERVVDQFTVAPPVVLKSGGIGVQAVRAITKATDLPAGEAALWSAMAIELGLVGAEVVASRGRGRNRTVDERWRADTDDLAAWRARSAPLRWARLVQQWLESEHLVLEATMVTRYEPAALDLRACLVRDLIVRALARLDAGVGWSDDDAAATVEFLHDGLVARDDVTVVLAEGRALGLVDGSIAALTPTGRALLGGVGEFVDACAGGTRSFVVQGDHSVIAPPDLDAEVAARLQAMAEVESAHGAQVLRITDASVGVALGRGMTGEEIVEFLRTHSSVGVPQNVERTITDAVARHGLLRSGAAGTWLCCDDVALLARAVSVKAAKLTLLAPTVAVSPLAEPKVIDALAAKKVAVSSDTRQPALARGPGRRRARPVVDGGANYEHVLVDVRAAAAAVAALPDTHPDDHRSPRELHLAYIRDLAARERAGRDGVHTGEVRDDELRALLDGDFDDPTFDAPMSDELSSTGDEGWWDA